jgi:hypothetical protein
MAARIAALAALAVLLLALPAAAQDVESRYQQAGAAFRRARVTAGAPAETWRRVAAEYRALHDQYPQHARGADALYAAALASSMPRKRAARIPIGTPPWRRSGVSRRSTHGTGWPMTA